MSFRPQNTPIWSLEVQNLLLNPILNLVKAVMYIGKL
jgi:hypothetical protein